MTKKTFQERFIAALTAEGYERIISVRTHKYVVFRRDAEYYYYLGKSGSLRIGRTVATSIPCRNSFKAALLGVPGGI